MNNLSGLNPMFRDTSTGDYSLLPCSPLIDAGNNSAASGLLTDLAGNIRIQGSTVDIGAYEAPTFELAASPVIRPACTNNFGGEISITPAHGCEPYTYQWSPPAGTGPVLNELPPGQYAFTVTDATGRTFQNVVEIPFADAPIITTQQQNVICGSPLGGSITVNVSNGTTPYIYEWSNGHHTAQAQMLPAGTYQLSVTDANGCQDTTQVNITMEGQLTLSVSGESISCFGESDGKASAVAINGKSPVAYQWSQGATDSLLSNLGPGQYIVTATDFYGCTSSFTFNLANPALLQALSGVVPTSNVLSPNGLATAFQSGGTQPYTYVWSTGETNAEITGLAPGIYTVTVTDAHDCTATTTAEVKLLSAVANPEQLDIKVWPNPMLDKLELQAEELPSDDYRFLLRDVLGREMKSVNLLSGRALINVSGLVAGTYTWSLAGADGRVIREGKVIKW